MVSALLKRAKDGEEVTDDEISEVNKLFSESDILVALVIDTNKQTKLSTELVVLRCKFETVMEMRHTLARRIQQTASTSGQCKLPKLKPPTFSGDMKEYPAFKDRFLSAVKDCPPADQFEYLVGAVEGGDAERTLAGLSKMTRNFSAAMKLMDDAFGCPEKTAQLHYDTLDEMQMATDGHSQLENLEIIKKEITNLIALDVPTNQDLLKSKILSKFPASVVVKVSERLELQEILKGLFAMNSTPEFKKFLESLFPEIATGEDKNLVLNTLASLTVVVKRQEKAEGYAKESTSGAKGVAAALVAGSNVNQSHATPSKQCAFCGYKNHESVECRKYRTLSDRRGQLEKSGLCLLCLNKGHLPRDCPKKSAACTICRRQNHAAHMCVEEMKRRFPEEKGTRKRTYAGNFLETFICRLNNTHVQVRGVVDSCSQHSYIDKNLVTKLGVKVGKSHRLDLCKFGTEEISSIESRVVRVPVESIFSPSVEKTFTFMTTPCITGNILTSPSYEVVNEILPKDLRYADPDIFTRQLRPIQMIIGNDHQFDLYTGRTKFSKFNIALRESYLGWIPTGKIRDTYSLTPTPVLLCSTTEPNKASEKILEDAYLDDQLSKLWSLESLGIKPSEFSNIDDIVLEEFRQTYRFENNRYVVCWPWKNKRPGKNDRNSNSNNRTLPCNYKMCMARLKSLFERETPEFLAEYDQVLKDQLEKGIIEYAPYDTPYDTHYLPHRAIIQKGKIRLVYDGSARTKTGKSLNDELCRGPLLLENLIGLFLRFRFEKVGLSADIEKAFLQIVLNLIDRDVVRFLWVKDITRPLTKDNIVVFRFTRVCFGIISSPFLLHAVLQELLTSIPINKWCLFIKDHFYVDNLVVSVKNALEAIDLYHAAVDRLRSASFNLRDWASNDPDFLRACNLPPLQKDDPLFNILGMNWHRLHDTLLIKANTFDSSVVPTKRVVLQFFASIYDPLGLINPGILKLKFLIQDCWKQKFGWDLHLPKLYAARYEKLARECDELTKIEIPRLYWEHSNEGCKLALHIFCDASKKAYACCAYLTSVNSKTQEQASALIYSKARLAPVRQLRLQAKEESKRKSSVNSSVSDDESLDKNSVSVSKDEMSIPKLELMAVTIGKRAAIFLKEQLKLTLSQVVLWTDATTVIQWLNSTNTVLPIFVKNRVDEINNTQKLQFSVRYVPTHENPADVATKGTSLSFLTSNTLWWKGPSWINHESAWPVMPANTVVVNKPVAAMMVNVKSYTGILSENLEKRFEKWHNYIRFFLYWHRLRCMCNGKPLPNKFSEYKNAEIILIKELQKKYFAREIQLLSAKNPIQPNRDLDLTLDKEGIIRCRGRLQNAPLPFDTKNPILLPRDSPIIMTLIRDIHIAEHHVGTSHVLSKIRERFWIIAARPKVNSVIHKCVVCRRWEGGCYKLPPMAPLPKQCVNEASPFQITGLDYLGPVMIKEKGFNNTFTSKPMYVCLFTCLVTRAVHLELARNLSGGEFLLALQRFCSRRGTPSFILSDNATNFTFVQPLVSEKVDKEEEEQGVDFSRNMNIRHKGIIDYLNTKSIHWKFIPPLTPWQGGAYERLVSLVKRCLKKSFGSKLLDELQFQTALAEIEDTLNDRPLTYVPGKEIIKPLTPNDFLRPGRDNRQTLEVNERVLNPNSERLIRVHSDTITVLQYFWDIFRKRYLTSLRETHQKRHKPSKGYAPYVPRLGEIVLIKEAHAPRATWNAGVIVYLDKRQAIAHVKSKGRILIRPINLLSPLELVTPCVTLSSERKRAAQPSTSSQNTSGKRARKM